MKEVTIPLVGNPILRGGLTEDQIFTNVIPVVETNPVTQSSKVFLQKRPGTSTSANPAGVTTTANFYSIFQAKLYETSSNNVYLNASSIGSVTANYLIPFIGSTIIGGKEYVCFVAYSADGSLSEGYYHVSDATVNSFTGDRTSGSAVISNIASTTGLYSGQLISATGFTAAARILSVDSATQVTINENASSGAATSTVVTVASKVAKILDSDFPTTAQGGFAFLDGFVFLMDRSGKIWNSDINTVTSWAASSYISANTSPDQGKGVYEFNGMIVGFGRKTVEFFQNAGNPFGSPLTRIHTMSKKVGLWSYPSSAYPISTAKIVDDTIYFVGQSEEGVFAYSMSAGGLKRISTVSVSKYLAAGSQSIVGAFSMLGQIGIAFNVCGNSDALIPDYGSNYVYWLNTGIWTKFTGPTDGASDIGYWHTATYNPEGDSNYLCGAAKRFLCANGNPVWRDDSVNYSVIAQTVKTDFETDDIKSVWEVALMGSDIQSSGTATLEYSDNDYSTWTTAGTFDLTTINPRINRVGSFRGGRAWRLTHSANTDFRAQALKFKYSTGAH